MPEAPVPSPSAPFSKWRSLFWPIHAHELKKVIPMLVMFFFISLIYSLLRNTKDTLIVTSAGGGAELIPFLKVYGVIPGSILFVYLYSKVSNIVSSKALFLLAIVPFLVFFSLFFLLFQYREVLEPWALATRLQAHLPHGLMPLVAMFRHWVLSVFYVMAELWGSMALSLLFWGFANQITRVDEAKRFYALFGIGANLALIAVKLANGVIHYGQGRLVSGLGMEPWPAYVLILTVIVVAAILCIVGIFLWMNAYVLTDPLRTMAATPDPKAQKASLRESVGYLWQVPALKFIAILVIAYGVAINLIEVTWKSYLGLQYPNPSDYQDYMVNFSFATGLVTVFLMLFVSSNVIRSFGWTIAALVTPVVLLVTGAGFFGFILGQKALATTLQGVAMTPLAMGVLFGTIQNIMSKASKYSLFDPTKEMAYIPLDHDAKVKGKAAIDVVGARFGKAAGSLLQQVLIGLFGSLQAVTGYIAVLLFGIIGLWIWADVKLGKEFARLTGRSKRPAVK